MTKISDRLESKKTEIKKFDSIIQKEKIEKLLELAKESKKTAWGSVGSIENKTYVPVIIKNLCSTKRIDFSSFESFLNGIVDECRLLCEQSYNVKCKVSSIEFLYYENNAYYWPHIDGQFLDNITMKRRKKIDISCILYLNDDYEDGEIYFKLLNKTFKPSTGEIITFPGSWEFLHGVHPVKGERYSVVMWFESDPFLYDEEIIEDERILHFLQMYK